jgi:hypothetical protein
MRSYKDLSRNISPSPGELDRLKKRPERVWAASHIKVRWWGARQSIGSGPGDKGFPEARARQRPDRVAGFRHIGIGINQSTNSGGTRVSYAAYHHSAIRVPDEDDLIPMSLDGANSLIDVEREVGGGSRYLAESRERQRQRIMSPRDK